MSNGPSIDLGFDLDSILGKSRSKTNFKYLEEGTAVYRILPAFDAENRQLMAEHNFHWAQDAAGKNIKVQCTYYTEKYCPFCNAHRELEKQYKAAEANEPAGSDLVKRLAAAMQKLQKTKQFYYNALTINNEVVVLQLSKTVSDLLNKKLAEAVQEKNQDPTSLTSGYWFKFSKSGKGRDSVTVDFHRTSKVVDGEEVEVLNRTPVPKELIETVGSKVAKIHNRKSMWIKEYTGVELADYLRGTPLKDKFKQEQEANKATSSTSSYTAQGASPQASGPADSAPSDSAATASEPKQESSSSSAAANFAAEAKRLRELASGKQ